MRVSKMTILVQFRQHQDANLVRGERRRQEHEHIKREAGHELEALPPGTSPLLRLSRRGGDRLRDLLRNQ